jgi:hypothetical protein
MLLLVLFSSLHNQNNMLLLWQTKDFDYVNKIVSDLRQVGGFLRVLRFPSPIELTAIYN